MSTQIRLKRDDPLTVQAREGWMARIDDAAPSEREAVIEAAGAELHLGRSSIYHYYKAWKDQGQKGLRRPARVDTRARRALALDDELAWIDFASARTRQALPVTVRIRLFRELLAAGQGRELACSDGTLRRVWDAYLAANPQVSMTPKETARGFKRQLRMGESEANRVWQWDQHTADFEVVDEDTGELYRPIGLWLVERCSGVKLGGRYFRHYDTDAVEEALFDSIYPAADGSCPYHGLPEIIHGDNGKQFTSKWARRLLSALKIRLSTGHPGEPTGHGYVESFHGLVGQFERGAPRYLGRDALKAHKPLPYRLHEEGVAVPEWSQPWTLGQANAELQGWMQKQMQQPYLNGPSRDDRFWASVSPERLRVPDPRELAWQAMETAECSVRGGIIQIHSTRYQGPHLGELNGQRVEVRYLRWDLRHLWVLNQDELFCVAEPLEVFSYGSDASHRALRARNREFAGWMKDVRAAATLVRAGAEISGVSAAEAAQAAETMERMAKQLKPAQHDELQRRAGGGADVIDLARHRPLETTPLAQEAVTRPSVTADDLVGEAPRRREVADRSEWI